MNEIFKRNLRVLKERQARAAHAVEDSQGAKNPVVEIFPARSGAHAARVFLSDGRAHALHSAYDPAGEARRFAAASGASAGGAVAVLGFGLGHHVRALQETVGPDGYVAAVEESPAVFEAALQHVDIRDILSWDNFSLFIGGDSRELAEWLKSVATDLVVRRFVLCEHGPSVQLAPEAYRHARADVENVVHSARTELITLRENAATFFENTWLNLPAIARGGGVKDLFGKFPGLPAINIAAGPSLDFSIGTLKSVGNKALLIAVDTALKPLLENGIVPHIVVAVDPSRTNARYFECVRGRRVKDCILVCSMSVSPPVLEYFDGPTRFIDDDGRLCRFLRSRLGERGTMNTGLSVAHTAFYLARAMGCDPIALVGQDLSFARGKTHAAGTERTWGGTVDTGDPNVVWLEGNDGGTVPSLPMFRSFLATFEREIAATQARVINATEGGALIRGCERAGLNELLDSFDSDVAPALETVRGSRGAADFADVAERLDTLMRNAKLLADDAKRAEERIERTLARPPRADSDDSGRAAAEEVNRSLVRILEHAQVLELLEDVMIEARLAVRYGKGGGVRAELARALKFAQSARGAAKLLARCIAAFLKHQAGAER